MKIRQKPLYPIPLHQEINQYACASKSVTTCPRWSTCFFPLAVTASGNIAPLTTKKSTRFLLRKYTPVASFPSSKSNRTHCDFRCTTEYSSQPAIRWWLTSVMPHHYIDNHPRITSPSRSTLDNTICRAVLRDSCFYKIHLRTNKLSFFGIEHIKLEFPFSHLSPHGFKSFVCITNAGDNISSHKFLH